MSHAVVLVAVECKEHDIEDAIQFQMEPFDEKDECFRNGSRWDWWVIGGRWKGCLMGHNFTTRKELSRAKWELEREEEARADFRKGMEDDEKLRSLCWGITPGMTEDEYAAKHKPIYFGAFLHNRHWHENERLGWFGGTAKSECQIGREEVLKGKCLVKDEKTGAQIVGWNDDKWQAKFWDRFIEPLAPDTWLVAVDYHV